MKRRAFIMLLGGAAAAWTLAARAQQPVMPIVGLVSPRSPEDSARLGAGFRKALSETGYIEGQNVMVEYHWVEGQYDRLPALMADLVRRRVAVIAMPAFTASGRQFRPAGRQCDRHQFFGLRIDSQAARSAARPDAQGGSDCRAD